MKSLKPYVDSRSISIYLSMPEGEIQTDAIVRDALTAGKHVFVPYLHRVPLHAQPGTPARVMDMVRLKNIQDYECLQRDRWGIPSIDPATVHERQRVLGGGGGPGVDESELASLDLILMPGVAFDTGKLSPGIRRLGHGKGFYDLFLHRYAAKAVTDEAGSRKPVLLYGLALTEQLLSGAEEDESVPVGPQDQLLHGLVLGNGHVQNSNSAPIDT